MLESMDGDALRKHGVDPDQCVTHQVHMAGCLATVLLGLPMLRGMLPGCFLCSGVCSGVYAPSVLPMLRGYAPRHPAM